MAEEKTFSAKQIASRVGTEAKTLRKFFRDPKSGYDAVGQGGRYDFPESDLPKIKAAFDAWNKGKTKRKRPTNAQRALAEKAGVVPAPRKEAEAAPARPRRRANEPAPSPLDEDDLHTRLRMSIGERAKAKGVTTDRTGRWVEAPKPRPTKPLMKLEEARKVIPGLAKVLDKKDADSEAASKKLFAEALEELEDEELDDDEELDYDEVEEDDEED